MTTLPTPAEVAEARAFLTGVETGSVESFLLDLKHSEVYRRHAAVLVRAALAAPAEQPREDDLNRRSRRYAIGFDWSLYDRSDVPAVAWEDGHRAARSVSPSAVPAVSAGRDLTAQDVEDAYGAAWNRDPGNAGLVAEYLNRIARPADTVRHPDPPTDPGELCGCGHPHPDPMGGCWADGCDCASFGWPDTLASTEYRVAMDFGPRWMTVTADEAIASLRDGRRVEHRSVSPWSPVAVHDENGAQR